ncbi:FAD-dependent monooxygenase [Streptomyces sp. NPDC055105]|uniref:FAD-dependent monooxygenase n=1 Tax=Streptomyces sp. NPDC055105 TaxID=3365719 RepID=UPI0037D1788A
MPDYPVVIVGAGPVGLFLAGELQLAGVETVILEQRLERGPHSRAGNVNSRTLEILDSRGMVEPFLDEGVPTPALHFAGVRLTAEQLITRFPHSLMLSQRRSEEFLEAAAVDRGARLIRGSRVLSLTPHADGVRVVAEADGTTTEFEAQWVVGCDGTRSTVRGAAGIGFEGMESTVTTMLGEVTLDAPPQEQIVTLHNGEGVTLTIGWPDGTHRVVRIDPRRADIPKEEPVTLEELADSVRRAAGSDWGMRDATWLARTGNASRLASTYRKGRVLLAGDSAHMHSAMAGQGMNTGLADAFNLGWKLAGVITGQVSEVLLDTYDLERRPVGAALIHNTRAQHAIAVNPTLEGEALRELIEGLVTSHPTVHRELAATVSGLVVHYPHGVDSHPLVGSRMPDIDLADRTATGRPRRIFEALRDGRFVVVLNGGAAGTPPGDFKGCRVVEALDGPETWGGAGADLAIVRPDGYVAWAGRTADAPASWQAALPNLLAVAE